MKVEIRNNSVLIDGYVNAVERKSKVLRDAKGQFVETIKAGVFQRALERAKEVKVLLNHNYDRELTSTKESTNARADVPVILSQIPSSPSPQNEPSTTTGKTRATATEIIVA